MNVFVLACLMAVVGLVCYVVGSGVADTVGIILLVLAGVAVVVGLASGRDRTL